MSDSQTPDAKNEKVPNAQEKYEISKDDLPLHCPMEGMSIWNSHPRVYIPMDKGHGKCPYCGAEYTLLD